MSDDTPTQTSGAQHIGAADFESTLKNEAGLPVLVDFYADWCGPCKMAEPVINKFADEYRQQMMITKLDVDDNQQVAADHGVMSIPTVIVFKNGQEVERKIGYPGEDGYRQLIERHLDKQN